MRRNDAVQLRVRLRNIRQRGVWLCLRLVGCRGLRVDLGGGGFGYGCCGVGGSHIVMCGT
jgi:hypothetical protein